MKFKLSNGEVVKFSPFSQVSKKAKENVKTFQRNQEKEIKAELEKALILREKEIDSMVNDFHAKYPGIEMDDEKLKNSIRKLMKKEMKKKKKESK